MEGYWYYFPFKNGDKVHCPQLRTDAIVVLNERNYCAIRIGDENLVADEHWAELENESFQLFKTFFHFFQTELEARRRFIFTVQIGKVKFKINQNGELKDKRAEEILKVALGEVRTPFVIKKDLDY